MRVRIPKGVSSDPDFLGLSLWIDRSGTPDNGFINLYLIEDSPNESKTIWGSGMTGFWDLMQELGTREDQPTANYPGLAKVPNSFGGMQVPPNDPHSYQWRVPSMPYGSAFDTDDSEYRSLLQDFVRVGKIGPGAQVVRAIEGLFVVDGDAVYQPLLGETPNSIETKRGPCYLWRDSTVEFTRNLFKDPIGFLKRAGAKIGYSRQIDALVLVRKIWVEITLESREVFVIGYPVCIASSPSPLAPQ